MRNDRRTSLNRAAAGLLALSIVSAGILAAGCKTASQPGAPSASDAVRLETQRLDPAQAATFISYNRSITLTSAQRGIMERALSSIPAPCCAKYTMATCCCPCNLAKSSWGLSKYLIAERGYEAPQVRKTVLEWLRVTNPGGYTGNACFTGGCARSFADNGCGGMNEKQVVSHR